MADTPLIANIDVDMIPSASLSASLLAAPSTYFIDGCTKEGKVFVIPAFEVTCKEPLAAEKAALAGKKSLQRLIQEKCVLQFRWAAHVCNELHLNCLHRMRQ